jgi:hypothetical protein
MKRVLLLLLLAEHAVSSTGLDISPIDDSPENGLYFVDTENLANGTAFYDEENLTIQLLQDGPIWSLQNNRNTSSYFSGETADLNVSISLMRYTSNTTGRQALTGIVHERSQNMFYEIRPDSRGFDTVRMTHEDDLPPMEVAEPSSLIERMTTFDRSTSVTSTWVNRISNALGLQRTSSTVIDVMIIWSESSECFMSGLPTGCSRDSTTRTNMEAAVDLMIAETNTAMINSGTRSQLSLVHQQVDSSGYKETAMSRTLRQLKDKDGTLDYVLALR